MALSLEKASSAEEFASKEDWYVVPIASTMEQ